MHMPHSTEGGAGLDQLELGSPHGTCFWALTLGFVLQPMARSCAPVRMLRWLSPEHPTRASVLLPLPGILLLPSANKCLSAKDC